MKRISYPLVITLVASLALCPVFLLERKTQAQPLLDLQLVRKISPDILDKVLAGKLFDRVPVVIQSTGNSDSLLDLVIQLLGGSDVRKLDNLRMRVGTLEIQDVLTLISRPDVTYISLDRDAQPMGHVSLTTGADQIRNSGGGNNNSSLDGTGIGIAILDSGIDTGHHSFLDRSNNVRVVYSKDFTNEGRTDDPYGHGTHVASLAAGNGRIANGQYVGIAPNANIINLRVLNARGMGNTTSVLRALDWIVANRTTHNIRVVNMSLGMPALDSYRNDPVCRAVRMLVDAGVVVFAAAGNNGKDSDGNKVYGRIHSPGNEPSVITVGASNTFGTDQRDDDGVASFSSRGPTRSFFTDNDGVKRYDNVIKPDLVAPGNKLIDAEADNNYLVKQTPSLDAGVSNAANRRMMYLSGTSMATPVAAGAAALMLQANPSLTPNVIKVLMMYSAQPLAGFNMFDQGAGQLNVAGAVQLARLVHTDLSSLGNVGSPLLVGTPPAAETTIGNHTFSWSRGIILNYTYATGVDLVNKYQLVYGRGEILDSGVIIGDAVLMLNRSLFSDGVIIGDHILISYGVIIGDGVPFIANHMLFQNQLAEGSFVSDGVIIGDGVIYGDGVIIGDVATAQSAMRYGDNGSMMIGLTDSGVDFMNY